MRCREQIRDRSASALPALHLGQRNPTGHHAILSSARIGSQTSYTLVSETPRVITAPDCAFLLKKGDQTAMYYLEQDRATSGIRRIAASKTPGYAELAKRNLHRRHFQATVEGFRVLMVAPHPSRRDGLRKEFIGKPGCDLWRFAAAEDVTLAKVMHEPVWYPCEGNPVPLVK